MANEDVAGPEHDLLLAVGVVDAVSLEDADAVGVLRDVDQHEDFVIDSMSCAQQLEWLLDPLGHATSQPCLVEFLCLTFGDEARRDTPIVSANDDVSALAHHRADVL